MGNGEKLKTLKFRCVENSERLKILKFWIFLGIRNTSKKKFLKIKRKTKFRVKKIKGKKKLKAKKIKRLNFSIMEISKVQKFEAFKFEGTGDLERSKTFKALK